MSGGYRADPEAMRDTKVMLSCADIREITWIVGQFLRIAGDMPEVIQSMTNCNKDFAKGMITLAKRFAPDAGVAAGDGLDAVSLDDIFQPLTEWMNQIMSLALNACDARPMTPDEIARQDDLLKNVRIADATEIED